MVELAPVLVHRLEQGGNAGLLLVPVLEHRDDAHGACDIAALQVRRVVETGVWPRFQVRHDRGASRISRTDKALARPVLPRLRQRHPQHDGVVDPQLLVPQDGALRDPGPHDLAGVVHDPHGAPVAIQRPLDDGHEAVNRSLHGGDVHQVAEAQQDGLHLVCPSPNGEPLLRHRREHAIGRQRRQRVPHVGQDTPPSCGYQIIHQPHLETVRRRKSTRLEDVRLLQLPAPLLQGLETLLRNVLHAGVPELGLAQVDPVDLLLDHPRAGDGPLGLPDQPVGLRLQPAVLVHQLEVQLPGDGLLLVQLRAPPADQVADLV
mmetsp:Transcript_25418/g.65399  ORF Transcript_25418/g.65399 Transcript_25418/m.65399 type:complete len:318 (+) Transcript_25418:938-1891(+)